jgi:hypothetical protein
MRQAFEAPKDLGEGFNVLFSDPRVVTVKAPDGKAKSLSWEIRMICNHRFLLKTSADKLVKIVAQRLSVELSKFEIYKV